MPVYDYRCSECNHEEESIEPSGTETISCEECESTSNRFIGGFPTTLKKIIPAYPGCKKQKAGYVHTHGDKPKSKVQGCGFSSSR